MKLSWNFNQIFSNYLWNDYFGFNLIWYHWYQWASPTYQDRLLHWTVTMQPRIPLLSEIFAFQRHSPRLMDNGNKSQETNTRTARQQMLPLRWRHYGRDGVPNHQPHHCLLNCLFGRRSRKTSKLRVTGLCAGNSPGTGEFTAQMASNAENVSIWCRHHEL